MKRNVSAIIDVGTSDTRIVLVEHSKNEPPKIISAGKASSMGMHMGYVDDIDSVRMSIQKAISQTEKSSGLKIKRAHITCGGISMTGEISNGYTIVTRADKEITELDIKNVVDQSEENLNLQNKQIIYISPTSFKIDGEEVYGSPIGMKAAKLEAKTIFVTINKKHIDDLVSAVVEAGIHVEGIHPGILAASNILLSERQKMAGCALIDIGEDTTTLAIFENKKLISLKTYSIGGKDITGDIALYFKVSLEEAEGIKTGTVIGDYPKKQITDIIEARLADIFESIENHLKKIKRNGLLPAGIILTGGTAHIIEAEKVAKKYLNLPAQTGPSDQTIVQKLKIRDDTWYSAIGLALYTLSEKTKIYSANTTNIKKDLGGFKNIFKSFFSQLLP